MSCMYSHVELYAPYPFISIASRAKETFFLVLMGYISLKLIKHFLPKLIVLVAKRFQILVDTNDALGDCLLTRYDIGVPFIFQAERAVPSHIIFAGRSGRINSEERKHLGTDLCFTLNMLMTLKEMLLTG